MAKVLWKCTVAIPVFRLRKGLAWNNNRLGLMRADWPRREEEMFQKTRSRHYCSHTSENRGCLAFRQQR